MSFKSQNGKKNKKLSTEIRFIVKKKRLISRVSIHYPSLF